MKNSIALLIIFQLFVIACSNETALKIAESAYDIPFTWNNANVYFLLTDRFCNADSSNDINYNRYNKTAVNRGFQGGDMAGITKKIEEGYFNELGISAIWLTPFFEQIHGSVDEGTGTTYGYHGYWAKDWTMLDPNFGTEDDLEKLVQTAHRHGIRIIMDVVINHTGPVTEIDPVWPENWVRTSPQCTYTDYKSTVECTLVKNLPDIRTESESDVALPTALMEKWAAEGRLDQELAELDTFFNETGYPRAPKYYIIKWLTDYVRKYGINAYRLDTAKHTEEGVWAILRKEADKAYSQWKSLNNDVFPEGDTFYMVGEVYNYGISGGRSFNFGDTVVDFFSEGIDHLINFEFKYDANKEYEAIFSKYSGLLSNELKGKGVLNYLSSHDDGDPFDQLRKRPFEAATKLLLCPGASQIYYGDETSRLLISEGAEGDANLRSFMNWEDLKTNSQISRYKVADVQKHYQRLGQFRKNHPAVGAGIHELMAIEPYTFKRSYEINGIIDIVYISIGKEGAKFSIPVDNSFNDGTELIDFYSGKPVKVVNGSVKLTSASGIVLIGKY